MTTPNEPAAPPVDPPAAAAEAAAPPEPVGTACPSCGEPVDVSARFCEACGNPLVSATATVSSAPPAGACGACGANDGFDPDGFCLACGHRTVRPATTWKPTSSGLRR